jgi:7-carboxy-7-deazaguanine synthase
MLTVNEIFHSIQGESTHAGRPCVFVRLTACDLRCSWCDTPYAFTEGHKMSVDDVVERVRAYGCDVVEITGGEPLLQKEVYPLMDRLLDDGRTVMIETGGHLSADAVPAGVVRVIDIKCPGSGESAKVHWPNLERLRADRDEVKFVVKDRADWEFARRVVEEYELESRALALLVSPVWGETDLRELADWVAASGMKIRMQLQLHKYIWGADVHGV